MPMVLFHYRLSPQVNNPGLIMVSHKSLLESSVEKARASQICNGHSKLSQPIGPSGTLTEKWHVLARILEQKNKQINKKQTKTQQQTSLKLNEA